MFPCRWEILFPWNLKFGREETILIKSCYKNRCHHIHTTHSPRLDIDTTFKKTKWIALTTTHPWIPLLFFFHTPHTYLGSIRPQSGLQVSLFSSFLSFKRNRKDILRSHFVLEHNSCRLAGFGSPFLPEIQPLIFTNFPAGSDQTTLRQIEVFSTIIMIQHPQKNFWFMTYPSQDIIKSSTFGNVWQNESPHFSPRMREVWGFQS